MPFRQQITQLSPHGPAAVSAIQSIVEHEQAHHDHAAQEKQQGLFWPRIIHPVVRMSTEFVIWLGMKLG